MEVEIKKINRVMLCDECGEYMEKQAKMAEIKIKCFDTLYLCQNCARQLRKGLEELD